MEENIDPKPQEQPEVKAPVKATNDSLTTERNVLVVDEPGQRRDETVEIVKQLLPQAEIDVSNSPEEAEKEMDTSDYDTYVVNLLMPGYSSSQFVKGVLNHDDRPLLIGFSADKMSDAYDPKKGIKLKPLRRLFEIASLQNSNQEEEEEEE